MWPLSLFFLTSFFIIVSFFIPANQALSFRWMTIGMTIVSFIFYYTIRRTARMENKKIVGANLSAIVLKFILSAVVIIGYAFIFGMHHHYEFLFFFMAYFVYSIVTYIGAYTYK